MKNSFQGTCDNCFKKELSYKHNDMYLCEKCAQEYYVKKKKVKLPEEDNAKNKRLYDEWFDSSDLGGISGGKRLNKSDSENKKYFYISYEHFNPNTEMKETAIVLATNIYREPTAYLILEGDYRQEFEKCNTIKECINVFLEISKEKV